MNFVGSGGFGAEFHHYGWADGESQVWFGVFLAEFFEWFGDEAFAAV